MVKDLYHLKLMTRFIDVNWQWCVLLAIIYAFLSQEQNVPFLFILSDINYLV